jgi:hypothetical protein
MVVCLLKPSSAGAVVIEIEAALEAPGHHAATRGHALRRRAVAMRRHHAAAGQCVEIRRLDVLHHAVDAEIGVSVVVGVDEDDVGLVGSLSETTEGTEEHREEAIHGVRRETNTSAPTSQQMRRGIRYSFTGGNELTIFASVRLSSAMAAARSFFRRSALAGSAARLASSSGSARRS